MAALLLLTFGVIHLPFEAQAQKEEAARPKITLSGGPGDTMATAIVIKGAKSSQDGIPAEYHFLEKKYGKQQVGWKLIRQSLMHQGGKHYDLMQIELKNGTKKDVYFDITEFFGKF
jgi:pyruvoyl-dependent arginine decarboxylase (PvlArgDC)